MSEKTTNPLPLSGKRRYIAIAALAGLIATGGAIGATVTAQSTIADNKIQITKQLSDATVTATGTPLSFKITEGTNEGQFPSSTTYTLENTGETDATVMVQALENVLIPGATTKSDAAFVVGGEDIFNADGTGDKKAYFEQTIGGDEAEVVLSDPITVKAGESKKLTAYLTTPNGTAGFTTYDKTFDVKFDYINKQ